MKSRWNHVSQVPPRPLRRPTLLLQRSKNAVAGGFFSLSRERFRPSKARKTITALEAFPHILLKLFSGVGRLRSFDTLQNGSRLVAAR
jgi:hypothetical protein